MSTEEMLDLTAPDEEAAEATTTAEAPAPRPRRSGSPAAGRVLVYDQNGALGPVVHDAVASRDVAPEVVECTRPRALGDLLTEERFDVLVAGPGLDTRAGLERLRIVREEVPAMGLVLVAAGVDELDVGALVRAGAIDLVDTAGDTTEQMAAALDRALRISEGLHAQVLAAASVPPPAPRTAARVLTVASASGGCGKTFLATNLAWFLHHHGGRRTCIIDLDLQFGEVTSSLRLRPRYTIADLVQQSEDADLADHFEEFCEVHESGVAVLAAPQDPTEADLLGPVDVARVIDAARAHYDEVVVDTPPALADTVVAAFGDSDELLVMATLDVPSIRNLHVFLTTLERLGIGRDALHLVLNKAEHESEVELGRVLKQFPQGFDATLPYAREVLRSLNAGRVVLDSDPDADISVQLGRLLRRYLAPEAQAAFDARQAAPRTGRLRRLATRTRGAS